ACPECSKSVSRNSEFCPYCGTELINCFVCDSVIGGNQEIIICPKCGGSAHLNCLAKDDRKCPSCGKALREQET
ncbi:MAG: RING finger protein, partial [Candidatus Jordarchaeaceae archaeon]